VHRRLAALILMCSVLSSCASPRPVVYESEHLDRGALRNQVVACFVPDGAPDVSGVVTELVTWFDGDPAQGRQVLRGILDEALTGRFEFGASRWHKRDMRLVSDDDDRQAIAAAVTFRPDEFGILRIEATDAAALTHVCGERGWDYVLYLQGVSLTRRPGDTVMMTDALSAPVAVGNDLAAVGQVFLLAGDTGELLYQSYVIGRGLPSPQMKMGARTALEAFVEDLMVGLSGHR